MSFESDDDLELYPHVELELRAESRRSSREGTAQRNSPRQMYVQICASPCVCWART